MRSSTESALAVVLGSGTHGVDAGVGAAAVGEILDAVVDILLHEIDGHGARVARELQALGHGVDGDNAGRAQQEGAADGELAHRAAPPDGDRVVGLYVAEIRRHVAGRENVREEQDLLVAQGLRHLERADIGIGHAHVFGLAAGVAAQQVGITEQAGRRMAPQGRRLGVVRVGALASREEALLAEEALAAGDGERHDDAVADLQLLV